MGLDISIIATVDEFEKDTDFKGKILDYRITDPDNIKLIYYSKHYDLHNWFEKLYYSKGGVSQEFNGSRDTVKITMEDLDLLEKGLNESPELFTTPRYDSECMEEDIFKMRKALTSGKFKTLYYYSSW
jgi:hypothetical protein